MRDSHTHCPCNGVWLCATCHGWVHANPAEASIQGFIVPRYVAEPGTMSVNLALGWTVLDCGGGWRFAL